MPRSMSASRMVVMELLEYADEADRRADRLAENHDEEVRTKQAVIEKLRLENHDLRQKVSDWKGHAETLRGLLDRLTVSSRPEDDVRPDHVIDMTNRGTPGEEANEAGPQPPQATKADGSAEFPF